MANEVVLTREQLETGLAICAKPRRVVRKGQPVQLPPLVVQDEDKVALATIYNAERAVARHLQRLLLSASEAPLAVPSHVWGSLTPDESQRAALELASTTGVIVLSGGPGVGKTTVERAMLNMYKANGLSVALCAPTGAAAKRMSAQTGEEASTIHRLVGMQPGRPPRKNELEPLDAHVVVIDESSMVDTELLAVLLAAVRSGSRLLVVGDVDQLPSIGAGRVLFDLIESKVIPTVRLTVIHRQASESRIPYVARDINAGRCPDLMTKSNDVGFWQAESGDEVSDIVVRAVIEAIPAKKGFASRDIQVLAAQYGDGEHMSPCGIVGLNFRLQNEMNDIAHDDDEQGSHGVKAGRSYLLYEGDKVLHTRNNYDLEVMNGEIGFVLDANPKGLDVLDTEAKWSVAKGNPSPREFALLVQFGDRKVHYTADEARQLELAYCISVHKSQGNQFPAVVLACPKEHSFMLRRSLVYTGLTRAEKFVLFVGMESTIAAAARRTDGQERRTRLTEFVRARPE